MAGEEGRLCDSGAGLVGYLDGHNPVHHPTATSIPVFLKHKFPGIDPHRAGGLPVNHTGGRPAAVPLEIKRLTVQLVSAGKGLPALRPDIHLPEGPVGEKISYNVQLGVLVLPTADEGGVAESGWWGEQKEENQAGRHVSHQ
ncbi:MAG TPA: hypothetical protein VLR50_04740 [Desulfobacterales bacterium]|nr:hypothetical protein [Desulfobacterales bacterium]